MILRDLLQLGYEKVAEFQKEKTAAKLLLAGMLDISQGDIFKRYQDEIANDKANNYLELLDLYIYDSVPIQYLVGYTYFHGHKIAVDERVLIPRPETEYLVDKIIKKFPNNLKVLEIGTGSGAIAISLAKEKNYEFDATDIDKNALDVAKTNCRINQVDINLIQSDFYENIFEKYDLIISNPPYVSEYDEIDDSVLFEPEIALFSDNFGTAHLTTIISEGMNYLKPDGMIIVEHGHLHGLFLYHFVNINFPDYRTFLLKDLQGKDRFTLIKRRKLV